MVGVHPERPQLPALTGLRFFAASWVVMFHYLDTRVAGVKLGPTAVELFYVLSGFLMTYTYDAPGEPRTPVGRFLGLRLGRLYPVHLLGLALMAPLLLGGLLQHRADVPEGYQEFFARQAHAVPFILSVSLLLPWCPPHALDWNSPAWSIGAEVFFYVVFAALVLRRPRRQAHSARGAAWAIVILLAIKLAITLLLLWLRESPAQDTPRPLLGVHAVYGPLWRLPEFLLGMALGRLHFARGRHAGLARWGPWLGLGSLLAILALWPRSATATSYGIEVVASAVTLPSMALLVYSLAEGGGALGRLLAWRPLELLGKASYAEYLLQMPLALWFRLAVGWPAVSPMPWPLWLGYFAVLLLASVLVYMVLERPAYRWVRRRLSA